MTMATPDLLGVKTILHHLVVVGIRSESLNGPLRRNLSLNLIDKGQPGQEDILNSPAELFMSQWAPPSTQRPHL